MKLDHYILDYIPKAVKKVLKTSEANEISLLGYCMGGTMTTIFAALHPELPIRNIALFMSPIDFLTQDYIQIGWMNVILI